ncbi:C39 family peptidase [Candidatus Roizmanbacteria bacterium]|nr:C39 family peptidase [Candidatus Roizmanbacteria bacterium]
MIIKRVPFYSNTSDDTHCDQAAIRMVLKYFLPNKTFGWKKLEIFTGKKKGLWTWPMVGLINMKKMGFDVLHLTLFDYVKFAKFGLNYLREWTKDENVVKVQNKYSDIDYEKKNALEYSKVKIQKKILPMLNDIKKLLNKGYLVVCNVNSKILNKKEGYVGHLVVVFGYNNKSLYLHDPGLPPLKNREVAYDLFLRSWEYPNAKQKNIRAFKLTS